MMIHDHDDYTKEGDDDFGALEDKNNVNLCLKVLLSQNC